MNDLKISLLVAGRFEPRRLAEMAKMAEELNYDIFWMADERFFRDVYSELTLAALNTKRIQLGTCVTDPYSRHPALTAVAIATLDEISEGRAVLGIGAGVSGFDQLGLKRVKPVVAIREMVELVQRLLTGEPVDYHGQIVHFDHGQLDFRPIRPRIPIYIASNGEQGLALAGQIADGAIMEGVVLQRTAQWFLQKVERGLAKVGRSFSSIDLVSRVNVCIDETPAVAKDLMRPGIARALVATQPDFPTFQVAGLRVSREIHDSVKALGYTHDLGKLASVTGLVPDECVDALTLAGDAQSVANGVALLARNGIKHVTVSPLAPQGQIERTIQVFAEHVMPMVLKKLEHTG
jgi:5,10-methylenetetrahydromethanopterin reductase